MSTKKEVVKNCLSTAKLLGYDKQKQKDLQKELQEFTKDPSWKDIRSFLEEFSKSVSSENCLKPDELVAYNSMKDEEKLEGNDLSVAGNQARHHTKCLQRDLEQISRKIIHAKTTKQRLDNQLLVYKEEAVLCSDDKFLDTCAQSCEKEEKQQRSELNSAVADFLKAAKEVETNYIRHVDNLKSTKKHMISMNDVDLNKLLTTEGEYTNKLSSAVKQQFSEIADLMNGDVTATTPLNFSLSPDHTLSEEDQQKRELLNQAKIAVLGYSGRKTRLVLAQAIHAEADAILHALDDCWSLSSPSIFTTSHSQSDVQEMENELSKLKSQTEHILREILPQVMRSGEKRERYLLLGGEYRQKINKLRHFASKQNEVKEKLLAQCSRLSLMWMMLELELACNQLTCDTVRSTSEKFTRECELSATRRAALSALPSTSKEEGAAKEVIDGRDTVALDLHDLLVTDRDSNSLFATFESMQESSGDLQQRHQEAERNVRKNISLSHTLQSLRTSIDALCSTLPPADVDEEPKFYLKMSSDEVKKEKDLLAASVEQMQDSIPQLIEEVEKERLHLQQQTAAAEAKNAWVANVLTPAVELASFESDQSSTSSSST